MNNNIGQYLVALGFIVFAGTMVYMLFDEPEYEEFVPAANNMVVPAAMNMASPAPVNPNLAPGNTAVPDYISPRVQLSEGHWQGMEVIELTAELKQKLKIPMELEGVLIDEVTLNAMESGMKAGDILLAIEKNRVRTIEDVVAFSKRLQNRKSVAMTVLRQDRQMVFILRSKEALGFTQAETAPMILPSDIMPHPYRGRCTKCHPIGTTGHITPDPDGIPLDVPPIPKGVNSPHRNRGPCQACHVIY
ncbi:MAG: PDZ domain-containing protein [SAR324 cluster bacterium]|nr:PDZ domain-containing protein [SAR324 cluster bacterium]